MCITTFLKQFINIVHCVDVLFAAHSKEIELSEKKELSDHV